MHGPGELCVGHFSAVRYTVLFPRPSTTFQQVGYSTDLPSRHSRGRYKISHLYIQHNINKHQDTMYSHNTRGCNKIKTKYKNLISLGHLGKAEKEEKRTKRTFQQCSIMGPRKLVIRTAASKTPTTFNQSVRGQQISRNRNPRVAVKGLLS